jgi:hypothetical protein
MDRKRSKRRQRHEEPTNFYETVLFKLGSRLLLALVVILLFLTLVQCTVKKPEAPQWNTTFVVPVINRTYDMEELVSRIDQDQVIIDSTGDLAFSISEDLDTVHLNESDFSVEDLTYDVSEVLGPVETAQPASELSIISLDSLTQGFGTVPGYDTVIIPPNTQFMADADRQLQAFAWAEVSTGAAKMVVANQLGFTLYDVVVRVIDNSNGRTIEYDSLEFPLAHGEIDSTVLRLDGETITNDLRFSVVSHSDPINTVRVSPTGKQISTDISFPEPIEVVSAMAQIPQLDELCFTQGVGIDLEPSETIDSASLLSGSLSLAITNNTGLANGFTVSVPSLRDNAVPLTIYRLVAAGQTVFVNRDVAGHTLVPENDSIRIDVVVEIPGSGGALVLVNQTDSVSVDASLTEVSFSEVTGMFANTAASFDDIHEDLEVPKGFDNISLVTAMITVEVENGVDMPGYLDITLTGDNGKVISVAGDIEPKGDAPFLVTTITNDGVADFLTPIPEAIDVSGSVSFGDGLYHGTIARDDYVSARVRIHAPLGIKVNNTEVTDLDIEVEEIDQDDMEAITDHVLSARFVYTVTNHLPLGVTALLHLSNDSSSLFASPLLTIDTLSAAPAPVSLITGVASEEVTSSGEIHLDSDEIQILRNDTLYIRQQLFLSASDTSGVQLTQNDYITINGRIEVEYRFDGDF